MSPSSDVPTRNDLDELAQPPGNHMKTPFALIALCACVLGLAACDKTAAPPPAPMVNTPVPTESGATAGSVADPSVPSSESVFPAANPVQADPALKQSNGTLSAAQESKAMPLPGQNNDHSSPLGPGKGASSP